MDANCQLLDSHVNPTVTDVCCSEQKAWTVFIAALSRVPPEEGCDPTVETVRASQKEEEEGEIEIMDVTFCFNSRLAVSQQTQTAQTQGNASKRRATRPTVQRHMS
jgi:hypothetical protein